MQGLLRLLPAIAVAYAALIATRLALAPYAGLSRSTQALFPHDLVVCVISALPVKARLVVTLVGGNRRKALFRIITEDE
jgi:hypothetical protein